MKCELLARFDCSLLGFLDLVSSEAPQRTREGCDFMHKEYKKKKKKTGKHTINLILCKILGLIFWSTSQSTRNTMVNIATTEGELTAL